MPLKSARNHGFTLVELLLVVSIMLIMAGAMIPSFTGYLKNQSLKQAQETLKSDLRTIQNKALTGALYDQTVDVSGTARQVTHWGVRFRNEENRYDYIIAYATNAAQFAAECNTNWDDVAGTGSSIRLQGYGTLPDDMEFKSEDRCIFFDFLNGTIATTPPVATDLGTVFFGFTNSDATGNCRNMQFNTAGSLYNTNADACP